MASENKLVDSTSPQTSYETAEGTNSPETHLDSSLQSSYGTAEGTSSSETPTTLPETPASIPKPPPDQLDFEKIEVIPEKEDSKKTPSTLPTSPSQLSKTGSIKCRHVCFCSVVFAIAFVLLIVRFVLFKFKNYFFEAIAACFSILVCSVITCIVERGALAKEFDAFSPKFQRKSRAAYGKTQSPQQLAKFQDGNPMEPEVPEKQPLQRLKYEVDVHRGAEKESSADASESSQGPRKDSSSSDKLLKSSSGDSKTETEEKEAKVPIPPDEDLKTKSSSPTAKVLNLFLRRKS